MPNSQFQQRERREGNLEKHVQTGIAAVLMALLAWAGLTLLDVRDRQIRMEVRQVTSTEHEKVVDAKIESMDARIRAFEMAMASNANTAAKGK